MPILKNSDPQEDATELYVGLDLRGYRSWVPDWAADNTPILRPVHRGRNNPWTPGVNQAQCFAGENPDLVTGGTCGAPVPNEHCDCGFYGFFDPTGPNKSNLDLDIVTPCVVAGVIQGTGRVVLAERGFRAEKAELVALSPPRRADPAVRCLANRTNHLWQYEYARHQISHVGRCPCVWCRQAREDPLSPPLEQLAERYGVPWFDTFTDMTKTFPPTHQDGPDTTLPCIHDVLGIPHSVQVGVLSVGAPMSFSMATPGANVNFGGLQLVPGNLPTQQQSIQLIDTLAGGLASIFERVVTSMFHQPWPAQPPFTGETGSVVRKFWRWALTGSTSDTLE